MHPTPWICLALALGACQAPSSAPGSPSAAPGAAASAAPAASALPEGPVVGGYSPQDPKGPEAAQMVQRAEALLRAKHPAEGLKVLELLAWRTQVVAGLNHQLELRYEDRKGEGRCSLTIFQSLQGQDELTASSYAPR